MGCLETFLELEKSVESADIFRSEKKITKTFIWKHGQNYDISIDFYQSRVPKLDSSDIMYRQLLFPSQVFSKLEELTARHHLKSPSHYPAETYTSPFKVKHDSQRGLDFNRYVCFSFQGNWTIFARYSKFQIWPWKIQNQGQGHGHIWWVTFEA